MALFTTGKAWKPLSCPPADRWREKLWFFCRYQSARSRMRCRSCDSMTDSQITLCLVKKARLARPPRITVYLNGVRGRVELEQQKIDPVVQELGVLEGLITRVLVPGLCRWRPCSVSWLWLWLHDCVRSSDSPAFLGHHTEKNEFPSMYIFKSEFQK